MINAYGTVMINLRVESLQSFLIIASLLSLILGTVVGLAQTRIKRLLAYSTVSHIGFILLALAVNSEESIESYLFYISQYTVTAINSFFVILGFGYMLIRTQGSNDIELIKKFAGLTYVNPFLSLALAASLFSMAGAPPLIGFFAKQSVLYSAIHTNHVFMAIVGIVVSVISTSYYLKIVRVVHFDTITTEAIDTVQSTQNINTISISSVHAFIIAILTMIITLYIFNPSIVLDSVSVLALNFYSS